jgi:hypothetical protein
MKKVIAVRQCALKYLLEGNKGTTSPDSYRDEVNLGFKKY